MGGEAQAESRRVGKELVSSIQTVLLATRGIAHSTRGRFLSGRCSTFSGYLTSEILSDRRPTLSGCLTTAILSGRHPLYPDVSQPQFYPADIPLSPDISQPQLYPTDVPPSPDISHPTPDAGWERRAIQLPRSDMSGSSASAYPESIRSRQFRFPGQFGSSNTRDSPDPFPPTIKRQTPIILTTKSPELSLIFNSRSIGLWWGPNISEFIID